MDALRSALPDLEKLPGSEEGPLDEPDESCRSTDARPMWPPRQCRRGSSLRYLFYMLENWISDLPAGAYVCGMATFAGFGTTCYTCIIRIGNMVYLVTEIRFCRAANLTFLQAS